MHRNNCTLRELAMRHLNRKQASQKRNTCQRRLKTTKRIISEKIWGKNYCCGTCFWVSQNEPLRS